MKKILSFVLLLELSFAAMAQVTERPSIEKAPRSFSRSGVGLRSVQTSLGETILIIDCGQYGMGINQGTYIEYINPETGKKEKKEIVSFTNTYGYTLRLNEIHYDITFGILHFPPLPNGVDRFDMIEPRGFELYGVHINPVSNSPLFRIAETDFEMRQLLEKSEFVHSGFYETTEGYGYKFVVLQSSDSIFVAYAGQDKGDAGTWKYGEVKSILRATAIPNTYKAVWYMWNKSKESVLITFDAISMTVSFDGFTNVYIKMGGSNTAIDDASIHSEQWTGTGYAIGDGYIVTNNHVVDGAKTIAIKGVKGDMNTGYTAEVVTTDKVNDIAILRITDSQFTDFGTIPYAVQQRMADVGEDVFVLGYPLTQALGDEIKLTNGIISSRTGYQGNISTYQMSAPVQPGNSGGPMFDNKGNVIGIVVAGVPGAENVGYAIKTSYLKILIESAGLNIQFPSNNTISALSLAEKVKRVRNFVFYIECSK